MKFTEKLHQAVQSRNTVLCVGLDPDPARIPEFIRRRHTTTSATVTEFCRLVIDATRDLVVAYKPNLAFYEALGSEGIRSFESVIQRIPENVVSIADAKRGDIGNTASKYAEAFFKTWKCDSITVSPLMGFETIDAFLSDSSKAIFALTLTSNPGANDFLMKPFAGFDMMSEFIAYELAKRHTVSAGHPGMVVGATRPELVQKVVGHYTNATLLIPGVGAQGGDVQELQDALASHHGIPLVNVSRAILYASETKTDDDFKKMIRDATLEYIEALKPLTRQTLHNLNLTA
jgi:orotidine-5'-phosphate decarboxylase